MTTATCSRCKRRPGDSARGLCGSCYHTFRTRQVAYGRWTPMYVDATPTRDHLEALIAMNLSFAAIGNLTGIAKDVLRGIVNGRGGYPPVEKVHRKTQERVLAVPVPTMREAYKLMLPRAQVDITGTRRRLRALMAIGYVQADLCDRISGSTFGNRQLWSDRCNYTNAGIAARVVELFDELHLTPGPSDRARRWAAKRGWDHPLAWDEDTIDDPNAEPYQCVLEPRTKKKERVAPDFPDIIADHRALGRTNMQIAASLGITIDALEQRLHRAGIPISTGRKGSAA
ncbi:hypothetical protein [Mycolicibacterium goodii]|uniref:hypothetical protein n=1 Tax=Mycolicibacterium goodii TaxID=134601 RepID=UPI001BDD70F0|nr:hypothetical protein [Mycolicibacterium goodii]MBU8834152.1 hypothetical protein [Mycolicibacterium goodii]